jgi:hypothetical protein
MKDYETFLAKIGGFLRRRGFDYSVSAEAARTAWDELAAEGEGSGDPQLPVVGVE